MGGIQCYTHTLITSLQKISPSSEILVHSFSGKENDAPELHTKNTTIIYSTDQGTSSKLKYTLSVMRYANITRPQVIFSTHISFLPLTVLVKKICHSQIFQVCHGVECWEIKSLLKKIAFRYVDQVLAVSNFTKNKLISQKCTGLSEIRLHPGSFDESRFEINPVAGETLRRKLGYSTDDKIILTVTRLSADEGYKGYDRLIRLMPEILHAEPRARYVLVGKGSDLPRVEKLVGELGLQNHVHLAGFVPDDEIGAYYNMCDVFCMPSHGEGFGIVFLEAMSCGKPVIGGNADGSRDALCDGELGWMVDPKNDREILGILLDVLARRASHPLAWQPEKLRSAVINRYGRAAFEQRLKEILRGQGWSLD